MIEALNNKRLKFVREMHAGGGQVFNLDTQEKLALNKTGFLITTLLLQGKERSAIIKEVQRKYRGARRKVVEGDINGVIGLLEDFVNNKTVGTPSHYRLHQYTGDQPLEIPLTIYWEVTLNCNLQCMHCYTSSGTRHPQELETAECMELIREWGDGGVCEVVIGGGEPFTRRDMVELIAAMHQAEITVTCVSNGTLITEDLASKLRDVGLTYMAISLDGHTPELHNRFRGTDFAFHRAVEGVQNLKKADFTVALQTVTTQLNKDALAEIANFAWELGADSWEVKALNLVNRAAANSTLALNAKDMDGLVSQLQKIEIQYADKMSVDVSYPMTFTLNRGYKKEKKPANRLACGPGFETAGFTADGRLLTCSFIRGPGWMSKSVRDAGFKKLWETSPIFEPFRNLSTDQLSSCKDCSRLFDECWGGCRARAFAVTGDFFARDPMCRLHFPEAG